MSERNPVVPVFMSIGAVLLMISAIQVIATLSFLRHAARSPGKVIEVIQKGTETSPVVEFVDEQGERHVFHTNVWDSHVHFSVGEQVTMMYSPAAPESALIGTFGRLWGWSIATLALGTAFCGVAWRARLLTKRQAPMQDKHMTLEEFSAEARRLARPCRYYRFATGTEPVSGYWHGVKAGTLCASIERNGEWLNVYLDEEFQSGRVEVTASPILSDRPLCRSDAESLPPVDAVFLFGSAAIGSYLDKHGWQRDWEFNNNFKGRAAHEYTREWAKQCPLYMGGIVAVEGGWNVPWPEGDWRSLVDSELVLWTLEESEPWVEVFNDTKQYTVFQRVT